MAPLYVVEQGAVLHRDGERLVARKEGQVLLSLPVFKVDSVIVFGAVQITTQAMAFLLANGIEVSFLSMEGRLKGRLMPAESKNVLLRVRQFERARDEEFRLQVARAIVAGKLMNARTALLRYARNHPEVDLSAAIEEMRKIIGAAEQAENVDVLRGLEGRGSAVYFQAFGRMVRGELGFDGRNRRPPTDPVNGMLSFGYSLLTQEMMGLVAAHGFDVYVGFYHDLRYGRPGLALDLVEEFRAPVVDGLVLWLANKRVLGPEDFETRPEDGAVLLRPWALRKYLVAYEQRVGREAPVRDEKPLTWREVFRRQVERMVRSVRFGVSYEPVQVEG